MGIEDKFRTQNLKALALYLSIFESPDNSIKSTYTVLAEPFYPSRGRFRQIGRYRGLKVYRKLEDSP